MNSHRISTEQDPHIPTDHETQTTYTPENNVPGQRQKLKRSVLSLQDNLLSRQVELLERQIDILQERNNIEERRLKLEEERNQIFKNIENQLYSRNHK